MSTQLIPTEFEFSVTGTLSFISSAVVVAIGLYSKLSRENLGKMILTINIANLLYYSIKISGLFFDPPGDIYCKMAMGIARGAITLSLITGSIFGHAIYIITKYDNLEIFHRAFKYYVIIALSISTILGTVIAVTNYTVYSEADQTCAHESNPNKFDITLVLLIILPTTICAILSIAWFLLASIELKKRGLSNTITETIGLQIYPAIVIICWIPSFIILLVKQYVGEIDEALELTLQNFFQLQGFMDALAYVIVPKLQNYYSRTKNKETEITIVAQSEDKKDAQPNIFYQVNDVSISDSILFT